jgi:uncharacterized membrane protein
MLEVLHHLFAAVCGQNPEHTWAPGGVPLPFCQRCTGLYVGAGAAWLLHRWLKPRPTARFLEVHGAFLLLMAPCGFHWVPQGPVLRTLSGALFGFAVVAFLWLPVGDARARWVAGSRRFSRSLRNAPGEATGSTTESAFDEISVGRVPAVVQQRVNAPPGQWAYAAILAATLVLVPLFAAYGGKVAAYVLCGLASGGAAALGLLVLANAVLGLCGLVHVARRAASCLRISTRDARTPVNDAPTAPRVS